MVIKTVPRFTRLVASAALGSLVGGCLLAACDRPQSPETVVAAVSGSTATATATAASASLTLQVLANSCGANQVQNFFQVTNTGSTAVPLSAIQIKFWPDDTTGQKVVPQVSFGGCVSDAGNSTCVHQVTGVTAAPTSFSACGTGPQKQANWEITVSNTDKTLLPPGATWSNIQSQVHLTNFGNFSPGAANWYSSCVSGGSGSYVNTGTFALYQSGQLVRTSTGVPPACRAPSGTQTITGNVPPAVATAPLVGSLAAATVLSLNISLKLQSNGAPGSGFPPVTTFIDQLSNPTAASRPAPLTPAGFAAAYGPTATDYNHLTSFATTNGLTVARTFTARNMLAVTGTVAAIENAFSVTLNVYRRPDGTTFYAPANDPSLTPGASVASIPILGISGLDNFAPPIPAGGSVTTFGCTQSPVGLENAFYGSDFANAYFSGCASRLGQGQNQTVALYEQDSYNPSNITAYTQGTLFGETALNVPANLTNVTQELVPSSTPIAFGKATFTPGLEEGEVELDMTMVLAVAPRANLIVYEGSGVPATTILSQIADDDLAQTISSSWFWGFSTNNEQLTEQSIFYQYAAQSQSFFLASGDLGALVASSPYNSKVASPLPSAAEPMIVSPYITTVGGTELTTTSTVGSVGTYASETAWNDTTGPRTVNGIPQNSVTTGGFCTGTSPSSPGAAPLSSLPIPSWQTGVGSTNGEVTTNPSNARMAPDVSLIATGIAGVNNKGGIACTGGTSASAPLWAAFTALINQANGVGGPSSTSPIGFLNPALYHFAATTPSAFNDIADGSNNNWFDDGQKIEGSSDGAGIPLPPTAETVSTSKPPVNTFSALPGAPLAGTSESPGLYHAVAGYDLVTGLGTPTCNLLAALAPSLAIPPPPPPPPPPHVIIKYSQLNEACTFYSDSLDPGAIASAGSGNAYVFFGITGIENDGNAPFSVDLANLFVPPGVFASPIGSDLELSLYAPFAEDTSVVVPANFDLEYQVDAFVGFAVLPRISDTTVASFFLNYSLNPSDPSVTNPQVTFIRTNNPAVTSFSISDPCSL
jgi:hypothetical protein